MNRCLDQHSGETKGMVTVSLLLENQASMEHSLTFSSGPTFSDSVGAQ